VESHVNHPLADAIALEATRQGAETLDAEDVHQVIGQGAGGRVLGKQVVVGRPRTPWMQDESLKSFSDRVHELARQGRTTVAVSVDDRPIGLIALADLPRAQAASVLQELGGIGIRHIAMLTGDHREAGQAVARELGIEHCHAELLPEDKLQIVDDMEDAHGSIAMIGDGVNDAPALARATVGIAMGAAGADVAMETADIVLMGSDLRKLPEAVGVSRFSRRIIAQNLLIALGVIIVVGPLAALGFANLGLAVLLHEGSTVVVVINSLRLLRYRREGAASAAATDQSICAACGLVVDGGCRFGLMHEAQVQTASA
jgi:Cd2+/Zn2+-exporting ATPase